MREEIAPGFCLSFDDVGEREADALVLITGAGSAKEGWGPMVPAFSPHLRVISFDCRGLGESDPGPEPLSMGRVADDVAAVLDRLDIGRAHVLGWSFGSAVAQQFALRHPERLAALVLWSTWARTDGYLRAVFTGLRYPFAMGDIETAVTVLGTVFSPELLDSPEFAVLVEQLVPAMPRTAPQIRATVEQWDGALAHDTSRELGRVGAPVLVVAGEQDVLAPPRYGRSVADLLPRARFELFTGPGSSHALGLERLAEFAPMVLSFLAEHPIRPHSHR